MDHVLSVAILFVFVIFAWVRPVTAQPTGDWDPRFRPNPIAVGPTGDVSRDYQNGTNTFHAMAADGDELFLGGSFKNLHDLPTPARSGRSPDFGANFSSLAWFDGIAWRLMETGVRDRREVIGANFSPGTVKTILIDGSDVYVGGQFWVDAEVDGQTVPVSGVARWSRTDEQWYGLSYGLATDRERQGANVNGAVEDLFIWNGDLYAAGNFEGSCTTSNCNDDRFSDEYNVDHELLARWNGTQWRTVDPGITRFLSRGRAVSFYDLHPAPNGDLIAAGNVEQVRDAQGNDVYCDGIFRVKAVGGVSCLAGGSSRNGTDGIFYSVTVDEGTGDLVVGGVFTSVDDDSDDGTPGTTAQNIARWDGTAWSAIGLGLDGRVRQLRYDAGAVQAFGDFPSHAVRFTAGAWQPLGNGTPAPIRRTVETSEGLVAASDLLQTWDGATWSYWGLGLSGEVVDLDIDPADGKVYVVGSFAGPPGARSANGLAVWDGQRWEPVGGGATFGAASSVDREGRFEELHPQAVVAREGVIYVTGRSFSVVQPGGQELSVENAVARWDGQQWALLPGTLVDYLDGRTCGNAISIEDMALTTYGELYVGGCFGGVEVDGAFINSPNFVGRFGEEEEWFPTGGFDPVSNLNSDRSVFVLEAFSGGVYVGGTDYRTGAGGRRDRLRSVGYYATPFSPDDREALNTEGIYLDPRFDFAWVPLSYGAVPNTFSIAPTPLGPYVAGPSSGLNPDVDDINFGLPWVGQNLPGNVGHYRWGGLGWVSPSGAPSGISNNVTYVGGKLFISGQVEGATPHPRYIQQRDIGGGTFALLDGGVGVLDAYAPEAPVHAMAGDGPRLYVGGALLTAGGAPSGGFAIWGGGEALADSDGDGISDADETIDGTISGAIDTDGDGLSDAEEAGDNYLITPPADTDQDGTPDFRDPDDDGDGIGTATEISDSQTSGPDPDGDQSPNWLDTDSDGDTVTDQEEGRVDENGDGVLDYLDGGLATLRLDLAVGDTETPLPPRFRDLRLALSYPGLASESTLRIERRTPGPQGLPSGQELAADRSWTLDFEENVTFEADVCFDIASLRPQEAADLTRFKIYKRADAQSPWTELTTALRPNATAPLELCVTGVTSFSEFVVTAAPDALPVELGSFTATTSGEAVELRWETLSETSNTGFRVERAVESSPGATGRWTEIGAVDGAGTTTESQRYTYTDREVPFTAEPLQYRLRQVDVDGAETVSDPIRVALGAPDAFDLRPPFPNPSRSSITLQYMLPRAANVQVEVYDLLGRQIATFAYEEPSAGRVETQVDVSQLASGTYFLRVIAGGDVKTERFTVVQ